MKSIKEKAAEYRKVIEVINEHESLVDTRGSEMFEAGANYVLEQIEKCLQGDLSSHSTFKLKCIKQIIKELKQQSV